MTEELPHNIAEALRGIGAKKPSTIRPEREEAPARTYIDVQGHPPELEPIDVVSVVKSGWRTSEFWVAIVGGLAGALAVAKGWISETALADLTQNLGAPYILGRSLYKFAPSLLERLKK